MVATSECEAQRFCYPFAYIRRASQRAQVTPKEGGTGRLKEPSSLRTLLNARLAVVLDAKLPYCLNQFTLRFYVICSQS